MRRTSVWLSAEDDRAIEVVRLRYGLCTLSDAIRFAVRLVAKSDVRIVAEDHLEGSADGGDLAEGQRR